MYILTNSAIIYPEGGIHMLEKRNYEYNKQLSFPAGTINGQGRGKISTAHYGLYNMAYNGCGIIGLYNFYELIGEHKELADIAKEMYPIGAVLMGTFGTNPLKLGKYFHKQGTLVSKTKSFSEFFNEFEKCDYAVISFWTGKKPFCSIHTVCLENAADGVIVYNYRNALRVPKKFNSLIAFLDNSNFIEGYIHYPV